MPEIQYHRPPAPMIPLIAREDVEILFEWHYYDGPLEGALMWEGKRYWYSPVPYDDLSSDEHGRLLEVQDLPEDSWYWIDQIQASDRGCAMFPHIWQAPVALLEMYPKEKI